MLVLVDEICSLLMAYTQLTVNRVMWSGGLVQAGRVDGARRPRKSGLSAGAGPALKKADSGSRIKCRPCRWSDWFVRTVIRWLFFNVWIAASYPSWFSVHDRPIAFLFTLMNKFSYTISKYLDEIRSLITYYNNLQSSFIYQGLLYSTP